MEWNKLKNTKFNWTKVIFRVLWELLHSQILVWGCASAPSLFLAFSKKHIVCRLTHFFEDAAVCLALDKLFLKFEKREKVTEALKIPGQIKHYECPHLTIDNGAYYCTNLAKAGSVCVVQCAAGYQRVKRTKTSNLSTSLMSSHRTGWKKLILAHILRFKLCKTFQPLIKALWEN